MAEYISREKIAAEARELSTHLLNEWDTMGVLALIDRQPAADVAEVRHGRWVNRKSMQYCSECGCGFDRVFHLDLLYCPHCGAKMDENEGEEPFAKDINVLDKDESEDENDV